MLLNARLPVGAGIPIAGAIYRFYMVEIQTGDLKLFRYGSVTDLSDLGCGPVRLAPDTKYWLEVTLQGSQYYPWKGWWSSLNDDILRGNPQVGVQARTWPGMEVQICSVISVKMTVFCPWTFVLDRRR